MKWEMIILKQIGSVVIVYNNSVIKYVSWANCKMKQIHKKKWNWYFYSRFIQLCFTKNNFSHSPWAPVKQKKKNNDLTILSNLYIVESLFKKSVDLLPLNTVSTANVQHDLKSV